MDWGSLVSAIQLACMVGFITAGLIFIFIGAIGILRLPDFYTRLHAAGVTDTLGAELITLGLIFHFGFSQESLKLLLIGVLVFLTSPTSTHAVANAAYTAGLKPLLGRYKPGLGDGGGEDKEISDKMGDKA